MLRQLVAGKSPWPLFLHGPPGTGKTCAALCLLDLSGGLYFTAETLAEDLIAADKGTLATQGGAKVTRAALWDEVRRTALVVLDEMGTRQEASDHAYGAVKRALDERHGRPMIAVSNVPLPTLTKLYDDRLCSRLAEGTVVFLNGEDRRTRK